MESFVRVARSGSFTVAANQLGLSRALVSRHVSDLEGRLGVRLLNRSTRSLNITEEGRAYLERCEQIFRDIEASDRAVLRARTEPVGTLKIAAPKSFGSLHLADVIIEFAKAQPRLRVSLILEDVSFRTSYDFVERGLDLALRISSLRHSSLTERHIVALDWIVCASPGFLERTARLSSPVDLVGHACLIHSNVTPNDRIWRFEDPKGPLSVKVSGVFFSNSALALRKAAIAGMGVTLLPGYVVADDLAAGRLVALFPRHKIAQRPLLAVHPRTAVVPQKIEVFLDFLSNWIEAREINRAVALGLPPGRRL
jgi:DNA-binding transcriptional LysR family regulator